MQQKFIVVRENKVIRVYETDSGIEGQTGIKKALENSGIDFKDVQLLKKLDDFEYAEGDFVYPYDPKDKRPVQEVIDINPKVENEFN